MRSRIALEYRLLILFFFNESLVLIGFPHDEGVRRNGGRVGAKDGPDVVRTFLSKIGTGR